MNELDYVAIDFETANGNLTSACSIGLVGAKNDKVVLEEYYLINPCEEFNDYNVLIHGITSDMVEDAPIFPEVWQKIKKYFMGTIIIAHNAMFDLNVLKALIDKYDLEKPNCKIACTLKISEKMWKEEVVNHKLNTISAYLGVKHNHHNALSDSYICHEIVKRTIRCLNVSTLGEAMERLGLVFGKYDNDKFYLSKSRYKKYNTNAIDNPFKGKIVAYLGKPKSMTKKEASEVLSIKGAILSRALDKSLDYCIIFSDAPKDKINALANINANNTIKVINESQFLELIK